MKILLLAALAGLAIAASTATTTAQTATPEQQRIMDWNRACLAAQGNVPASVAIRACLREFRATHPQAASSAGFWSRFERAQQNTVFASCYAPRATVDMETQIPLIVEAPADMTITRVRVVAGSPSMLGTDGQECHAFIYWSNGALESGVFNEFLNVYGQTMVSWRRTAFYAPGHLPGNLRP